MDNYVLNLEFYLIFLVEVFVFICNLVDIFCQVLISAKEEPDASLSPAMDGLLKVHQRIIDADTEANHAPPTSISSRLLVAGSQGGSLIGKQGATIKTIQDSSNCKIRVIGGVFKKLLLCSYLVSGGKTSGSDNGFRRVILVSDEMVGLTRIAFYPNKLYFSNNI